MSVIGKMFGGVLDGQMVSVEANVNEIHILSDGPNKIMCVSAEGAKHAPKVCRTLRSIYRRREPAGKHPEFEFIKEVAPGQSLDEGTDFSKDPASLVKLATTVRAACLIADETFEALMSAAELNSGAIRMAYLRAILGALVSVHYSKVADNCGFTEADGWLRDLCADMTTAIRNLAVNNQRPEFAITIDVKAPLPVQS